MSRHWSRKRHIVFLKTAQFLGYPPPPGPLNCSSLNLSHQRAQICRAPKRTNTPPQHKGLCNSVQVPLDDSFWRWADITIDGTGVAFGFWAVHCTEARDGECQLHQKGESDWLNIDTAFWQPVSLHPVFQVFYGTKSSIYWSIIQLSNGI